MAKPTHTPSYVKRRYIYNDLGISRTKLFWMIKAGEYPRPIRLASNIEAWPLAQHEQWKEDRINQGEAA